MAFDDIDKAIRPLSPEAGTLSVIMDLFNIKRTPAAIDRQRLKGLERLGLNQHSLLYLFQQKATNPDLNVNQILRMAQDIKQVENLAQPTALLGPETSVSTYANASSLGLLKADFVEPLVKASGFAGKPAKDYQKSLEEQLKSLGGIRANYTGLYNDMTTQVNKLQKEGVSNIEAITKTAEAYFTHKPGEVSKLESYKAPAKETRLPQGLLSQRERDTLTNTLSQTDRAESTRREATIRLYQDFLLTNQGKYKLSDQDIRNAMRDVRGQSTLAGASILSGAVREGGQFEGQPAVARAELDQALQAINIRQQIGNPLLAGIKYEGYSTTQGRLRGGLNFGLDIYNAYQATRGMPGGFLAAAKGGLIGVASVEGARLANQAYQEYVTANYLSRFGFNSSTPLGLPSFQAFSMGVNTQDLLKAYQTVSQTAIPGLTPQQQVDNAIKVALATGQSVQQTAQNQVQLGQLGYGPTGINQLTQYQTGGFNGLNQNQTSSLIQSLNQSGVLLGSGQGGTKTSQLFYALTQQVKQNPSAMRLLPLASQYLNNPQYINSLNAMAGSNGFTQAQLQQVLQDQNLAAINYLISGSVSPGGLLYNPNIQQQATIAQGYFGSGFDLTTLQNYQKMFGTQNVQDVLNPSRQKTTLAEFQSKLDSAITNQAGILYGSNTNQGPLGAFLHTLAGTEYAFRASTFGLSTQQYALLNDVHNNAKYYRTIDPQTLVNSLIKTGNFDLIDLSGEKLRDVLQHDLNIKIDQTGAVTSYSVRGADGTVTNVPVPQSPANTSVAGMQGRYNTFIGQKVPS